ncbi:MAG: 2-C-methyl-D-erythritol 4-phosphate cytidylyltransferase [Deltaproteobacteria bacterium]|nr:2-C-methyl-D-erythritol 4-phosphate cytidylyltransferase [Deltaproteobacteria bacterium]
MDRQTWAILLAAGRAERLKSALGGRSKQFVLYRGLPLFWHSVLTLAAVPRIDGLVLVFPEQALERASASIRNLTSKAPLRIPYIIVPGGAERQDSVWNALNSLPRECDRLLVHDAARPFLGAALVNRVLDALESGHSAAIPGLEPVDTIKQADENGFARTTLPRSGLRCIQTPQGFDRQTLLQAHIDGREKKLLVTDDAAMLEAAGKRVLIVPGEPGNRKITTEEDLALLEMDDKGKTPLRPCTGFGYDVHRYGGNRPCKLGGILIESAKVTIQAHSDGDALLHALTDALLGCAAAGDIGQHFPDSDARYDGMNSAVFLSEALELLGERGIILTHVDMTVVAQLPKISPFRAAIRKNIAHLLHLEEDRINLKATTEEGLGFTGAGQGIKAMAIVSGLAPE